MQAYHKAEKAKAIKKSKATQLKERTEKLSRRNPNRLQRQVDELREAIEAGHATAHNKKTLADLERDLAAVRKARKAMGIEDKEPTKKRGRGEEGGGSGAEGDSKGGGGGGGDGDWRGRRRDMRLGRGETARADGGDASDSGIVFEFLSPIPPPPPPPPPFF